MYEAAKRGAVGLAAVAILTGCGSSEQSDPQSAVTATERGQSPLPRSIPIDAFGEVVSEEFGARCVEIPFYSRKESTVEECPPLRSSEDDLPKGRFITALTSVAVPGKPLLQGVFLVFTSRSGKTCFDVQLLDRSYSGGTPLECRSPHGNCREGLCMVWVEDSTHRSSQIIGGPVPRSSRSVRVRFADGTSREYVANGPDIPGLPAFRAFVASLGSKQYVGADVQ